MEDIEDWVGIGKAVAKNLLELLGMDVLLRSNKHWNEVSAGINAVELISTIDLIDKDEAEDDCEDATLMLNYRKNKQMELKMTLSACRKMVISQTEMLFVCLKA